MVSGRIVRAMMSADGKPILPPPKPVEQPVVPLNADKRVLELEKEVATLRVMQPVVPLNADKRVLELEKEVATLRVRVETYSEPLFKDFIQCVGDAFKDDSKAAMLRVLEVHRRANPHFSNTDLYECLAVGMLCATNIKIKEHENANIELEKQCKKDVAALKKQLADLEASMYMIDGESKEDFYKNKFHEQLVCYPGTNNPIVCLVTGQVKTKSKQYEDERNQALVELERVKQLMPSDETNALLGRAKQKARVLKRKYKYLKTYLLENQYMSSFSDGFCDTDKGHPEDSDDDLRAERAAVVRVVRHDPGIPIGFTVRPASPDP
jgi:hypothetical protein